MQTKILANIIFRCWTTFSRRSTFISSNMLIDLHLLTMTRDVAWFLGCSYQRYPNMTVIVDIN